MHNHFLHLALGRVVDALRGGAGEEAWADADKALRLANHDDPELFESDLAVIVELRDLEELAPLVDGWQDPAGELPPSDKAICTRAMKALRKRLKLARLDEESRLGGSALTGCVHSSISGVRAPEQYPAEVWDVLEKRGRVKNVGHGLYEPLG